MPVSLAEAKAQLYVTHSADDGLIRSLIRTATNRAEQFTRRKLVYRKSVEYFNQFPSNFRLPGGWLVGVDSIRYRVLDGTWYTLDPARYLVDVESEPGVVSLPDSGEWPTDDLYTVNPIEITFSHGRQDGPEWTKHTAVLGEIVRPTSEKETGWVYICTTAGDTGDLEPTWAAVTTDGDAEWEPVNELIPAEVRQAILIWVTDHYESRGTMVDLQQQKFKTAELLLTPYRVYA